MVSCTRMGTFILLIALYLNASLVAQTKAMVDQEGDLLPPGAIARLGSMRFWTGGPVAHLAYSPDGKSLIAASDSGRILVWDMQTGQPIREKDTHSGEPLFLAHPSQAGPVAVVNNETLQTWTLASTLEARPEAQPRARGGRIRFHFASLFHAGQQTACDLYSTRLHSRVGCRKW